jgi:hypothetical protein
MDEFSNGKDIFNRSNRFYHDPAERFWIGTMFGMFVMLLVVLVYSKLAEQPDASQLTMPKDVVESYRMGLKDALRTNPPSLELEQTCLNMWADKQPVRE